MFNRRRLLQGTTLVATATILGSANAAAQGATPEPALQLMLKIETLGSTRLAAPLFDRTLQVVTARAEALPGVLVSVRTLPNDSAEISLVGSVDQAPAIETITSRGWVEFIDPNGQSLEPGAVVETTLGGPPWLLSDGTTVPVTTNSIFESIITSDDIVEVYTYRDQFDSLVLGFRLNPRAADAFSDYTENHIGSPMSIVVDNVVVSSPIIQSALADEGLVQGLEDASTSALAIQLSLAPLPSRVELLDVKYGA